MELEPTTILSSSQESVGTLFESNLPPNCYGLLSEAEEGCEPLDADDDLATAARQAKESGSITPLVKQELKLLIQSRRLSEGKDELRVGFARPLTHQLTQIDLERRLRRKDQNRRAAKRFRNNKKLRESVLVEEVGMLESKNDGLRDKISELQQLKDQLMSHLSRHLLLCSVLPPLSPSPPPPPPHAATAPPAGGAADPAPPFLPFLSPPPTPCSNADATPPPSAAVSRYSTPPLLPCLSPPPTPYSIADVDPPSAAVPHPFYPSLPQPLPYPGSTPATPSLAAALPGFGAAGIDIGVFGLDPLPPFPSPLPFNCLPPSAVP